MVCALYIPEVEFANVSTMEPIVLQSVPHERYNKVSSLIHKCTYFLGFDLSDSSVSVGLCVLSDVLHL